MNEEPFVLSSLKETTGIIAIFISNDCPYVDAYISRIKKISNQFEDHGISLILINSNSSDHDGIESITMMKQRGQEQEFLFPYLSDPNQRISKLFGARKTPEAFLLKPNGSQYHIVYRGAIDDNPQNENDVDDNYLIDAANRMIQRKAISNRSRHPAGCMIN